MLTPRRGRAADDDPLLVHVVEIRARNLMWGLVPRRRRRWPSTRAGQRRVTDRARSRGAGAQRGAAASPTPAARSTRSPCSAGLDAPSDAAGHACCGRSPRCRRSIATGRCVTAAEQARRGYAEQPTWRSRSRCPTPASTCCTRSTGSPRPGSSTAAAELAQFAYDATPPSAAAGRSHVDQLPARPLRPARRPAGDGPAVARRGAGPLRRPRQRRAQPPRAVGARDGRTCSLGAHDDARAAAAAARRPPTVPVHPAGAGARDGVARRRRRRPAGGAPALLDAAEMAASAGLPWARRRGLLHDVARLGDAPRRARAAGGAGGARARASWSRPTPPTPRRPRPAMPAALVDAADRFERLGHGPARRRGGHRGRPGVPAPRRAARGHRAGGPRRGARRGLRRGPHARRRRRRWRSRR